MFQALRKLLAINMFWWRTSNSGQTSRSWLAFCSWAASCTLSSSANRFLSQKQADYFPAYSKVPNSRQQQREYFRSNMNYADKNRYFEQCSFITLYKTKETYSKLSKHNQVYMTYPYSLREIYFDGNSNTSESLKTLVYHQAVAIQKHSIRLPPSFLQALLPHSTFPLVSFRLNTTQIALLELNLDSNRLCGIKRQPYILRADSKPNTFDF